MQHRTGLLAAFLVILATVVAPRCGFARESSAEKRDRASALRALCARLHVDAGATVAEVGCGKGRDSFVLASVVGKQGCVFAEEIAADKLGAVLAGAQERSLPQVVPILGQSDDPRLPNGTVDLLYMHFVFHHFAQPRAMLRAMWYDLKPRCYLAIADRVKGPLQDWAPLAQREKKHHWTGETTVVRLAREAGYRFVNAWDDLAGDEKTFLLIFQRPAGMDRPQGDPVLHARVDPERVLAQLPSLTHARGVVLVGLGAGRQLLRPLIARVPATAPIYDVVLEEWATAKNELPAGADDPRVTVVRTAKGKLVLPEEAAPDVVLFADAYHRLWQPVRILQTLRSKMAASGRLLVVDREGPAGEDRRLANHRRQIAPARVRRELERAGFKMIGREDSPGPDHFMLLFAPQLPAQQATDRLPHGAAAAD